MLLTEYLADHRRLSPPGRQVLDVINLVLLVIRILLKWLFDYSHRTRRSLLGGRGDCGGGLLT